MSLLFHGDYTKGTQVLQHLGIFRKQLSHDWGQVESVQNARASDPVRGPNAGRDEVRIMMTDPIDVVRTALLQALIIAVPILGSGLFVGLLVSLFQSVTQIQEQTLTFVPKIIVMILVAIVLLGWISVRLGDFAYEMFTGL